MSDRTSELLSCFRLKPTRAAKVSEISEATASSATPPEERVNFHIGNPVQERRLTSAYLRAVLGLNIRDESLTDDRPDAFLEALDWPEDRRPIFDLFTALVRQSGPYLPRGGFSRNAPSPPVLAFVDWLQHQQEPLSYDLGKTSGRREIILCSGGIVETLRVMFHALSGFLPQAPAHIFAWKLPLPSFTASFKGLRIEALAGAEQTALEQLRVHFDTHPERPTFLLLGSISSEEMRRALRLVSLERPLFFIEANDAPNHLSLAREAKLIDRVVRLLTPGIFDRRLHAFPLIFAAGNAEYLGLLETIHFQLKGTPSASESALLAHLLQHRPGEGTAEPPALHVDPPTESAGMRRRAETAIGEMARRAEQRFESVVTAAAETIDRTAAHFESRVNGISGRVQDSRFLAATDQFSPLNAAELTDQLIQHLDQPAWIASLRESYCSAFVAHHPEYDRASCTVVSGSSRTALGLLGFHCGIREAVIPDLSWTYEHCFPAVHAVPLTPSFGLDVRRIIARVEELCAADPHWADSGAVVLNNPHNATGRVFSDADVRQLLEWLLLRGITAIDDLSYHQVAPVDGLPEILTLRQHASELVRTGRITSRQAERVITVHSMSKTDCLAGARLSVVEIRSDDLRERFRTLNDTIAPNIGAMLLTYLFYRNSLEIARAYWRLRNRIFAERMQAIADAQRNLPTDRNLFAISILPPAGSMYPLLRIEDLPAGLSLDWIAAGLARQGIGLIPLSTFARTEAGFETGRKAFRLTLGGSDGAAILLTKTRRVLIDLNRLIAEEEAQYRRRTFDATHPVRDADRLNAVWDAVEEQLRSRTEALLRRAAPSMRTELDPANRQRLTEEYLHERSSSFRQRLQERAFLSREWMAEVRAGGESALPRMLERELFKDDLSRREEVFRQRLFDRTVHPTQMYSIRAEAAFNRLIARVLRGSAPPPEALDDAARELIREFLGLNVAITSSDEADEVILDLDAQISVEAYAGLSGQAAAPSLLSFWGDWDGSNRPSGQGHRLVASVLIENVRRLSRLLRSLAEADPSVHVAPDLRSALERLPQNTQRFISLLNEITSLTHQLERRYRGLLPFQYNAGRFRQIATQLHLARDPVTTLWHHNDRLERRMLDLRRKRREALEYYFSLNKQLRKELHRLLPSTSRAMANDAFLREAVTYRDLLQRFVLSPRIHQSMITAQDPFAIETTVFNINEINDIGARFGNPGMVLALQISMSTRADALVALDRKMRARREHILRDAPDAQLPSVRLVPLFEDRDAVQGLDSYLEKLWEYAVQSRRMDQQVRDRFGEMINEVFIAGSDLSQQVGQAAGAQLYGEAKHRLLLWLANHGLADRVRLKMGSGEPMQRQGGYYSDVCGHPAFIQTDDAQRRFHTHLRASTCTSTRYATTPMLGVFAGGDLRTLQSAIAERLRYLDVNSRAQLLHHLTDAQRRHQRDYIRAAEELGESRLRSTKRGEQALERLTRGTRDAAYEQFLPVLTENFRQILYGREDDVVGIHLISYFIARTSPPLRDRPTVRPVPGGKDHGSRILERIAATIPFARYGSLLRAIAHNQAQTVVLGINQLTTGMFRALDAFTHHDCVEGDPETFIADRILPHLPVYEILQTLRLYHDPELRFLKRIERALPAGNTALAALREDTDAMNAYLPLFRQELLRRHGIDVSDFFEGARFVPHLLPTLRPDLAVLMQEDLFNTDPAPIRNLCSGEGNSAWLNEVETLLAMPLEIRKWRERAWNLLEEPVYLRVESFVELAASLYALSKNTRAAERPGSSKDLRLPSSLTNFFRASRADDEMRQFLAAAVEYLSVASEGMIEVPANIVRAMREVERIARIEEQALTPSEQDRLRFYILQIARLTGENG